MFLTLAYGVFDHFHDQAQQAPRKMVIALTVADVAPGSIPALA